MLLTRDALLKKATEQLSTRISNARLDASLLLAHCLSVPRALLIATGELPVPLDIQMQFESLCQRRSAGEPLAYLLGEKEFWSLPFYVTPDTLIPRPETELLVEYILARYGNDISKTVADIGTGSGAIALSIASERPNWQIVGTDISGSALTIACKNQKRLGYSNVSWLEGDIFTPLLGSTFDFILSNPPYIAENDPHLQGDGVRYEPKSALVAEDLGLALLYKIIQEAPQYLVSDGWLFLEHGHTQGALLQAHMKEREWSLVETLKDLNGQPRVTFGRKTGTISHAFSGA